MLPSARILAAILVTSFAASRAVVAGGGVQQSVLPIRAATAAATAAPRGVVRVSVASDGTQSNGSSINSVITPDGRYVAFESDASNLVSNDTNRRRDVFVHDRSTGITTRESISSGRAEPNADCTSPRISSDGRFVAFFSGATNLIPGVTGQQIYVRDRQLGLTTVASVSSDGSPSNSSVDDFYAISPDGRFVTFATPAGNLVPGSPSSSSHNIYTRDRSTGSTTRDSVTSSGQPADGGSNFPAISDDGRYVAFRSTASNLVSGLPNPSTFRVFVYDRSTGQTALASVGPSGETLGYTNNPSLSGDGRFVAISAQPVGSATFNFYFRDRQTAQTLLVVANSGATSETLTGDGRFASYNRGYGGTNYVEVYDRSTGLTTTISPGGVYYSAVGGNAIAFESASPLVTGDTNGVSDIFVAPVGSDPGAPNPPTNLAYTLAGSTLTLTWTPPSSGAAVSDYLLEVGTLSRSTDVASFSTGNTDTRFSNALTSRGTFYIRVRAANAAGVSVPSNEIILAPLTLPGAPSGLTASVAGNTLTLTWSQATGVIVSYIIEAGAASGGTELANFNTNTTNTTFTAPNLAAGTYFVRIRAASLGGVGPASNEVSFTVSGGCAVPGAPTGLTWSVAGSSVTLSWTAGAGATSYVLEAGSTPGRSDIAVMDLNSSATTFATSGVPAGMYYVRIRTRNSCAQSTVTSNETVVVVTR